MPVKKRIITLSLAALILIAAIAVPIVIVNSGDCKHA